MSCVFITQCLAHIAHSKDDRDEQREEDTGACRHGAIAQITFAAVERTVVANHTVVTAFGDMSCSLNFKRVTAVEELSITINDA